MTSAPKASDAEATTAPPADKQLNRSARANLPVPTVAAFAAFALLFWLNAALNTYLFNVMLALLATVPLLYMLLRSAVKAHAAGRRTRPAHA